MSIRGLLSLIFALLGFVQLRFHDERSPNKYQMSAGSPASAALIGRYLHLKYTSRVPESTIFRQLFFGLEALSPRDQTGQNPVSAATLKSLRLVDSRGPFVYCDGEQKLEHFPPEESSAEELFECMRKLAESHDPVERFQTLWIGAMLGERLELCSDHEIGDLLSAVQDTLGLFSPEFIVCEHGKRRLWRNSAKNDARHLWRR